jgi:23S rRNA (cytosine1962-C5)-methyltransferase
MTPVTLRLKKDQDRRLLAGHLWVYSNEIDTRATPLKGLEPGTPVQILGSHNRWIGLGYANPRSLICARIVTRRRDATLDRTLLSERIETAWALRRRLYPGPYYRLVFGEADGLPGLVVDRFGAVLVLQVTTAGMERLQHTVVEVLDELLQPEAIVLRNDVAVRELEGLPLGVEVVKGEVPADIEIGENGLAFRVSPLAGQKTGWFFDQADNRSRMRRYVGGARLLDVCAYSGAWGVSAAAWGAASALCVDASESALARAEENARLNGCGARLRTLKEDAFVAMKGLWEAGERFDVVVLDPPAFAKRRKDLEQGLEAYGRLNRLGLQLLARGGILMTSSCSYHLAREAFLRTVQRAAGRNRQSLQLLESGQQGADHPVHPAIPETAYLKTLYLRAVTGF